MSGSDLKDVLILLITTLGTITVAYIKLRSGQPPDNSTDEPRPKPKPPPEPPIEEEDDHGEPAV